MKKGLQAMTNRELFTAWETADNADKYSLAVEMAKRIKRHMVTPDVVPIFKQYKLNGAGDQYN